MEVALLSRIHSEMRKHVQKEMVSLSTWLWVQKAMGWKGRDGPLRLAGPGPRGALVRRAGVGGRVGLLPGLVGLSCTCQALL